MSLLSSGIRELVIVGSVFLFYRIMSIAISHGFDQASQNAYDIINLEKLLGIFFEQGFQSFFLHSTFLIHVVNTIYTIFYYPVLIIFAMWAFIYHQQQYLIVRNVLVISATIAFICFALYPVAPPRMLPEFGFIDTMATHGVLNYGSTLLNNITNHYAAMPSCHFGWSLLIGIATIHIAKAWWLKIFGALLPSLMLVSILATANHFILDAVGGAIVIGLSYGIVRLFYTTKERALSRP